MAKPVIMPRLGQSVESCIIAQWVKHKGEEVRKGDVILSYETDKASFDLESESDGILLDIFYNEGDEVPVLATVGVIGNQGESTAEFRTDAPAAVKSGESPKESTPESTDEIPLVDIREDLTAGESLISPRARKLAEKMKVYYASLKGSGPGGRIVEKDILAAAAAPMLTPVSEKIISETGMIPSSSGSGIGGRITERDLVTGEALSGDYQLVKLSNIRKLIAKGMHNSLQNSAQLTHHMSADARNILALREEIKKRMEKTPMAVNITLNDMVCFAVVKVLKRNPQVNAHFLGDAIKIFNGVHLGFAVDTERGLIVPSVRNADRLSLPDLSSRLKELAALAKAGNIDPSLIAPEAATFTVSNLGAYGVEMFTPVINIPQVGILGVNTIISRPADLGNRVFGFVPYIGLSLTYDHRAIDGGPASLFLKAIKEEIEKFPSSWSQITK